MPVRVFHCDDSSAFRVLVREMLHDLGGVELVGEAGTLAEAMDKLPAADADVVLVDLFEHDQAGLLLNKLRSAAPSARMLLYTGMPDSHVPPGAEGHVHKSEPFENLHRRIGEVAART